MKMPLNEETTAVVNGEVNHLSADLLKRTMGTRRGERDGWHVPASRFAKNTYNPIRSIVETMTIVPNPEKPMIALSIGDPTVFKNLHPPEEAIEAVVECVRSGDFHGYGPSTGHNVAKQAVAEYCEEFYDEGLQAKDVILTSGCSSALDLCITVLCNPGQNILMPNPGFALYQTLAECLGIETKHYRLVPERSWEVDLDHLESLIDDNTSAIVINNPSNPCGSVFSRSHLLDILQIAERHRIPIIADEIYDRFVFPGEKFYPLSSLTTTVPILSCGGLTKRFMVPGWRLGWILICDRNGVLDKEVRSGLLSLSQRTIGSNTLIQGAMPAILSSTPDSFFEDAIAQVKENADLCYECVSGIQGLKPVKPAGAMYMMVGIEMERFPAFSTDLEFVERMVAEQSVFCLPGKCFNIANYFRIVLTVPLEQMAEACTRIAEFCAQHYVAPAPQVPSIKDTINFHGWKSSLEKVTSDSIFPSMKPGGIVLSAATAVAKYNKA